jgi:hypothetical protein
VAKLGLGTSLAAAGVAGAGVAGVLPAAANDAVRGAIEVVTPVEFHGNDTTNFGDRVSADATGDSDGENGVDGQQIADEAPGAANRPDSGPEPPTRRPRPSTRPTCREPPLTGPNAGVIRTVMAGPAWRAVVAVPTRCPARFLSGATPATPRTGEAVASLMRPV